MTDIATKLRDWGHPDWFFVTTDLLSDNQDVRFEAAAEIERLRRALEQIDAVAVSKKAGALVRMQRIARKALALPPSQRESP